MVGINPNFTPNYQLQTKNVAAQNESSNQQQTQQAETSAVRQPAAQNLQESTVKIPLETLQANAGVNPSNITGGPQLAHIGTAPKGAKEQALKRWLYQNDARVGDTFVWEGNAYIIRGVIDGGSSEKSKYAIDSLL